VVCQYNQVASLVLGAPGAGGQPDAGEQRARKKAEQEGNGRKEWRQVEQGRASERIMQSDP
jgi:hypothetical protein